MTNSTLRGFAGSKRGLEVLTGNLMMLMVMAAVFSSVAFIVKSSSDKYSEAQEKEIVEGISVYLKSKVSEAWGVGTDEVPLNLPEMTGGRNYIIESDASGNYLKIRTDRGTYRIQSSGIIISTRGIRSSQDHTIGIREGRVVINPPPLTEIICPLDGSVFSGTFNVSYRNSMSATEHSIYLDGSLVASSTTSLDGFLVDPDTSPTNISDGQHILTVVTSNAYGEGEDSVNFVVDRVPPHVGLNMSQILTNELTLSITEISTTYDTVEIYVFVTDDKLLPVRELDASNFYMYNSEEEFIQGGRHSLGVVANDSESRVDPRSYAIWRKYLGQVDLTRERTSGWDSKETNGTTTFWASASDIAGNTQDSANITKTPVNRNVEVGSPDRKSDLSIIFTNDVSGSMNWVMWKDEYPKPGEESRLDFMKGAVKSFIDRMFPEDEAAICSFATNYDTGLSEINLSADFRLTTEDGRAELADVVDGLTTRGGTPLYDALYQSVLWVAERSKFKVVLVLTDGKDLNYATGQPYSSKTSEEVIDLARMKGISIYCVGLGEEDKVDVGVLNAISEQTDGRFYLAPTPEKLREAYDQIAGELLSGYRITYKPGHWITGGEDLIIAVYDGDGRSGSLEITLPAPELSNWPPSTTVVSPNGGEVVSGMVQIRWTATDPEGDSLTFDLYYSDDSGSSWSPITSGLTGVGPNYSYDWDTTTVSDSAQGKVKVVADDGEWRIGDHSDAVFEIDNVTPDGMDPTVSITKPTYPPAKKVKKTVTIEGTASDTGGSGLDRVEIRIDGDYKGDATLLAGDSWEFNFDTLTLPNGIVGVEARAYDGAGNNAVDTIQMEINN